MITHDGTAIPRDTNPWDSDAIEWVSAVWDEDVSCHGAITSSTWIVPTGWTSMAEQADIPVTDCDGTTYNHANQIKLSTTETEGTFTITNRTVFANTTSLDRSIKLKVKPT